MKATVLSRISYALILLFLLPYQAWCGKDKDVAKTVTSNNKRTAASCLPSSSSAELNINNVRCLLQNGGDMWWDLVNNPRYEVPKVDNPADARHSSFASSIWIGGIDDSEQLRVAAQTYRQRGNDFWPGPLADGANITEATCEQWDKHFVIYKSEIDAFRAAYQLFESEGIEINTSLYPSVMGWPGHGEDSDGWILQLAPYVDQNLNGRYEPLLGDYPDIQGDQAIWWVTNDRGDVHTATGGQEIGIQIKTLAFAFATSNAVNDMTFYKYNITNKSTHTLSNTYMGNWVDSDIGLPSDDYVGCDIESGLAFCYNGQATDPGASGYGTNPPAFGMDFFQGPLADPKDGIDNNMNGMIDEPNERIGMSKFVYYENDRSLIGNPETAPQFYGYLRGFWKDGSVMVDNGKNGYQGTGPGPETNYMFPGDGGWGGTLSGWSEVSADNPIGDRRFLQSAGPFTMQSGAENEIITGAVWARGYYNDNKGSVQELLKADKIAQALFDADFQLLDGPDAPEVTVEEYDQELIISWGYGPETRGVRNNYNEGYTQTDPVLVAEEISDSIFTFQGYLVYQLKDNTVSITDLQNIERAQLIAQCDIIDDVTTIVNRESNLIPGVDDPVIVDRIMVTGANEGLFHSIKVTDDQFAQGSDKRLNNYTTYYYAVIAYSYNDSTSDGRQFVPGNRFFQPIAALPHKVGMEQGGTVLNSLYGEGIPLNRIAGAGNGGRNTYLNEATETRIFNEGYLSELGFLGSFGPAEVKVVNPKRVTGGNFKIEVNNDQFTGDTKLIGYDGVTPVIDSTFKQWTLYQEEGTAWKELYASTYTKTSKGAETTYAPVRSIERDHVIPEIGISIKIKDVLPAGDTLSADPVINSEVVYSDPSKAWLAGFADVDTEVPSSHFNWILSGEDPLDKTNENMVEHFIFDPNEYFENLIGRTWAPWCMAREWQKGDAVTLATNIAPGLKFGLIEGHSTVDMNTAINLNKLHDIDLVITSDTTKWSRCVVVETAASKVYGSGASPLTARWAMSVNKLGKAQAGTLSKSTQGMGWFPGYAIDLTTGERLNVFFGENSFDIQNHGNDMIFNPTSSFGPEEQDRIGGRHYVYVSQTRYDGCEAIRTSLQQGTDEPIGLLRFGSTNIGADVYSKVAWVGIPMAAPGYDFKNPMTLPSDARISLRVNYPFQEVAGKSPTFTFSTDEVAAQIGEMLAAQENVMENIHVVPNPYYGGSNYERSQIQTTIKITSLPEECTIRIFTLNGTLVRTFKKENEEVEQTWDLKNHAGVPVASGTYIVHIDAGDLGEKVVKMFAVMRDLDLSAF